VQLTGSASIPAGALEPANISVSREKRLRRVNLPILLAWRPFLIGLGTTIENPSIERSRGQRGEGHPVGLGGYRKQQLVIQPAATPEPRDLRSFDECSLVPRSRVANPPPNLGQRSLALGHSWA
jgi:hypothetical protein